MAAARQLFKRESYAALSSERIAAFAQVTRHTLNNHFSSKEEIFHVSREALLAEVAALVADAIPPRMETQDGIIFFLENCFSVYSCDANLELMTSILRDGYHHPWLEDVHQRQIRCRLIQSCETFLLYHVDRTNEIFAETRIIAEQLTSLAERMAYGPYFNSKGKGVCPPAIRKKNFAIAARSIETMLDNDNHPAAAIPPHQLELAQRNGHS